MSNKKFKSSKKPKKWDSSSYLRDVLSGKFLAPGSSRVKKVKDKKKEATKKSFQKKVSELKRKSKLKSSVYKKKH